jgi:hypothetical protein
VTFDVRLDAPARQRLGQTPGLFGQPMDALGALESVQAGLRFAEGMELYVRGGATSLEGGQRLYEAAAGWLVLGRMLFTEPDAAAVLGKLSLDRQGTELSLKVSLSAEEAERFLK